MSRDSAKIDLLIAQSKLIEALRHLVQYESGIYDMNARMRIVEAKQWLERAEEKLKESEEARKHGVQA